MSLLRSSLQSKSHYKPFRIGWAPWDVNLLYIFQKHIALLTNFHDHLAQCYSYYPHLSLSLETFRHVLMRMNLFALKIYLFESFDDVLNVLGDKHHVTLSMIYGCFCQFTQTSYPIVLKDYHNFFFFCPWIPFMFCL